MKKLLALAFVALMAGVVAAQTPGMGMFFSNTEFTDENTNLNPAGQFTGYIVLLDSPWQSIAAYEVAIDISDAGVFILESTGPNGWINYAGPRDHQVGYTTPLPVQADGTAVLCTLSMLYSGSAVVDISFGQSALQSVPDWDGPAISNGSNPTELMGCFATGGETPGLVATLNGDGVTATEAHSLTEIKALF